MVLHGPSRLLAKQQPALGISENTTPIGQKPFSACRRLLTLLKVLLLMPRLITVVSAVAVSCLTLILSNTAVAQLRDGLGHQKQNPKGPDSSKVSKQGAGGAAVATQITPQDAAKKYPAQKGKYPMGERDPHNADGVVNSPYPPRTAFDCSQVPHGGLVLDTHVNKVFVRP